MKVNGTGTVGFKAGKAGQEPTRREARGKRREARRSSIQLVKHNHLIGYCYLNKKLEIRNRRFQKDSGKKRQGGRGKDEHNWKVVLRHLWHLWYSAALPMCVILSSLSLDRKCGGGVNISAP